MKRNGKEQEVHIRKRVKKKRQKRQRKRVRKRNVWKGLEKMNMITR